MNREILLIAEGIKDAYEGQPWFGRSVKEILNEIDESIVFEKPDGQHSILELLWHMITWKEFTINRIRNDNTTSVHYFEENDWRELDHSDKSLWQHGLQRLAKVQNELVEVVQQQKDDLLAQRVNERNYNFRKLIDGIKEHDIYHVGQIAYIKKMLEK
ncbi:MAG TPA: DinB family protein [Flavisolibacter sp.]|nr:DinB family protein [Flavisolibacter sp.]